MENMQDKMDFMLNHGYELIKCNYRKINVLSYKGYAWTFNEIDDTELKQIKSMTSCYDAN